MEGHGHNAHHAHDEEHASLVVLAALEVGTSAPGATPNPSVVEHARAQKLDSEDERLLELVVHLGRAHGGVESYCMRRVLVRGGEETTLTR